MKVKYALLVYSSIPFFPNEGFSFNFDSNTSLMVRKVEDSFEDSHWASWLGSISWDEFSRAKIQIQTWMPTETPDILDAENQQLEVNLYRFSRSLLLCDLLLPPSAQPYVLSGQGEVKDGLMTPVDIRSFGRGPKWLQSPFVQLEAYRKSDRWKRIVNNSPFHYDEQIMKDWKNAYEGLKKLETSPGEYFLINIALHAFQQALSDRFLEFSFPNLVRSIETLVALSERQGRGFFARRAGRFLPPLSSLLLPFSSKEVSRILKEAYGLRSDAVHGKPFAYGLGKRREEFLKEEVNYYVYLLETLARNTIRRFLDDQTLTVAAKDRKNLEAYWNIQDPPPIEKLCETCGQPSQEKVKSVSS